MNYKSSQKESSPLRLFLFGFVLLAFTFGVYQTTQAAPKGPQPPPEAQCREYGVNYTCKGTQVGVPVNTDSGNSFACRSECFDAGGAMLRYDINPGIGIDYRAFCYGATDEKLCEIKNVKQPDGSNVQFVNTKLGLITPQEGAELKALEDVEKGCGSFPFGLKPECLMKAMVDKIGGAFLALLALLPAAVLYATGTVLGFLFSVTAVILKAFIVASMEIGVTPDAENIVETGWTITRDLVNMLFLLLLVFIGLATILRLQTYQMQKTLPALLIIALLVNFSGLFVGFFVDIGNILTNAFLGPVASFEQVGSQAKAGGEKFIDVVKSFVSFDESSLRTVMDLVTTMVVNIIFYLVAFLILVIIMIVFFVRVIALWVLAILAPLAFAAYILPATKQFWNQWFKNLIQWSFIGVPIAFFMRLAWELIGKKDSIFPDGSALGSTDPLAATIAGLFGNFAVLALMAVGIFISMQFVPQGAQGAIDFGKKWGGAALKASGSAAWRFRGAPGIKIPLGKDKEGKTKTLKLGLDKGIGEKFEQGGQWLRRKGTTISKEELAAREKGIEQSLEDVDRQDAWLEENKGTMSPDEYNEKKQELEDRQKKLLEEGENLPDVHREGTARAAGAVPGFLARWAGRGVELGTGEVTRRMKSKDEREIAEGTSEGTGKDSKDIARQINQELAKGALKNQNRIVGLLNAMVKNGDSDDLQGYMRDGLLNPTQIGQAIANAQRGGPPAYRPLMKALYHRMLSNPDQFGQDFETDKYTEKDKEQDKIPEGAKVGDIKRKADGITPVLVNSTQQRWVDEIEEKLSAADITAKILGDAIDKGKGGGREFVEHGGEQMLKHVIGIRGELSGLLLKRPESQLGRQAIGRVLMESVNEVLITYTREAATNAQAAAQKLSDTLNKGLGAALATLAGPGAQNAGISFPGGPGDVRAFNKEIAAQATAQTADINRIAAFTKGIKDAAKVLSRETTRGSTASSAGTASGGTSRQREGYEGGIP